MNIKTKFLFGIDSSQLFTEISFIIASCVSVGDDLVLLKISDKLEEGKETRRCDAISRILKAMKKKGKIQLYINVSELDSHLTEVEYLKNKYPDITELKQEENSFLLKL